MNETQRRIVAWFCYTVPFLYALDFLKLVDVDPILVLVLFPFQMLGAFLLWASRPRRQVRQR